MNSRFSSLTLDFDPIGAEFAVSGLDVPLGRHTSPQSRTVGHIAAGCKQRSSRHDRSGSRSGGLLKALIPCLHEVVKGSRSVKSSLRCRATHLAKYCQREQCCSHQSHFDHLEDFDTVTLAERGNR